MSKICVRRKKQKSKEARSLTERRRGHSIGLMSIFFLPIYELILDCEALVKSSETAIFSL